MLPTLIIAVVFGLIFGSFLNVCIARLPIAESILRPRSRCPRCGHAISAFDNIPILSWLILGRRCRHCRDPISPVYPLVELALAAWFAACIARFGISLDALNLAVFGFFLIGLFVMDWQTQILPDEFTIGGAAAGLFICSVQAFMLPPDHLQVMLTGPEKMLALRLLAIFGAAALLALVRFLYKLIRHRHGMGLGDVKMLALIAAFLGFQFSLLALFIGVVIAAAYGLHLLVFRSGSRSTRLPFGSFLALGGLVTALAGPQILAWYIALYR